jgi:hypothetical protein
MRAIVKGIGLSPASWNHFCQEFRKQGFLKNTATKGLYDVVSK